MNRPLLISGATILSMVPGQAPHRADLRLRNGCIEAIGALTVTPEDEILDVSGLIVLPGFIQTHVHLIQTLFRGCGDELDLLPWLKTRIWPLEAAHDPESVRASVELAVAELLAGGTTAILTMETVHHTTSVFETLSELPIYATVGKCLMDLGQDVPQGLIQGTSEGLQEAWDLYETWNEEAQGRLRVALAPRFALSCSEALHREVVKIARDRRIPVHTHASEHPGEIEAIRKEHSVGNIELLHQFELTPTPLKLAHCVHVDSHDLEILARNDTSVLHCPSANLKLGSGIAPVTTMREHGISVSLGSDGAACNNSLSMFHEMRTAALLQKMRHGPSSTPARDVLSMATLEGARALGRLDEMGSIEVGKKGNLVVLDLDSIETVPHPDLESAIVYSGDSRNVVFTLVDGQVVATRGEVAKLERRSVVSTAKNEAHRLFEKVGIV